MRSSLALWSRKTYNKNNICVRRSNKNKRLSKRNDRPCRVRLHGQQPAPELTMWNRYKPNETNGKPSLLKRGFSVCEIEDEILPVSWFTCGEENAFDIQKRPNSKSSRVLSQLSLKYTGRFIDPCFPEAGSGSARLP